MNTRSLCLTGVLLIGAAAIYPFASLSIARADDAPATAAAAPDKATAAVIAEAQASLDKAFEYFKKQQKPDNGWQGENDPPAITALVLKSFVEDENYNADMPFLDKGYDKLTSYQLENGGIYKDMLANYNTAIAVSALAAAKEPEYKDKLDKAVAYLRTLQWTDKIDGPTHVDPSDPKYGGTGYGKQGRPDLSNLQTTLDALHDAGVPSTDPAYAAAVKFVTRCQNLSETNDQKYAGNDGGFLYTPGINGKGESAAGEYTGPDGRRMLRSYGSMTYGGLKSLIYAGLTKDDPRVKAAWGWICKNYTVDENPGMSAVDPNVSAAGQSGLFYYYHTMARALHAYGEPIIIDAQGNKHDWRVDVIRKLASIQKPDGSWVNGRDKWMEGNPIIVTAYSALALEEIKKDLHERPVTLTTP